MKGKVTLFSENLKGKPTELRFRLIRRILVKTDENYSQNHHLVRRLFVAR
jgi:hypothetical protein